MILEITASVCESIQLSWRPPNGISHEMVDAGIEALYAAGFTSEGGDSSARAACNIYLAMIEAKP